MDTRTRSNPVWVWNSRVSCRDITVDVMEDTLVPPLHSGYPGHCRILEISSGARWDEASSKEGWTGSALS